MNGKFTANVLVLLGLALPAGLAQEPAKAPNFPSEVFPALDAAQCAQCHNDNGVASSTRLRFPPEGANAQQVEAFGLQLRKLVDVSAPAESLILKKPMAQVAHGGGLRLKPDSEGAAILTRWVNYLASLAEPAWQAKLNAISGTELKGERAVIRRLTHTQYNNTVRDLLGDESRPATQFPQEDFIHGFKNMAEGQSIPPLLAEAYTNAAERLAYNAFRGGDTHHLIPCKYSSPADKTCATNFVNSFGRKAFRRPLETVETEKYTAFLLGEAKHANDFLKGAQSVVEAMLQSPNFLLHAEEGPQGNWEQYRTASRLSYLLWDTMPDPPLFSLAEKGKLGNSADVEGAVRRMLQDPRAKPALEEFLGQWLRFDRALSTIRDRRAYPTFNTELAAAMTEETKALFDHLVWGDGDFRHFFNAPYTFVNGDLAKTYGLPAPKQDFGRVDYPAGSHRAGVLGQGLFLTLTSKPSETSPTERGLFVREHFLCQNVPSPPPGVNASLPPVTDEKPLTNRDRLKVHLSSESCSSCHRLIDPIGFGFEKFDAIGQFRDVQVVTVEPTREEVKTKKKTKATEYRLDLDTSAYVTGLKNSNFTSPKELGALLAETPACQKCVVKQLFRYALGRHETDADLPQIDALLERFRQSQFRFKELIIALATSQAFLGGPS